MVGPNQVQQDPAPVLAARMIEVMSRMIAVQERSVQSLELALELLNTHLGPAIVSLAKEADLVRAAIRANTEQAKALAQDGDLIVGYLQVLDMAFNDLADKNMPAQHVSFAKFINAYGLAADRLQARIAAGGSDDDDDGDEDGDEDETEEGEE
jgi:hypothetical protein